MAIFKFTGSFGKHLSDRAASQIGNPLNKIIFLPLLFQANTQTKNISGLNRFVYTCIKEFLKHRPLLTSYMFIYSLNIKTTWHMQI